MPARLPRAGATEGVMRLVFADIDRNMGEGIRCMAQAAMA
jgi:hypothetical protein